MQFQDYYQTLGVSRSASSDEIRSAYRKLAKEWHPDRHPPAERPQVEARFKQIAEAHEVLSDPEKRKRYDALGANWQHGQDFQPPPGGGRGSIDPEEFARMFGGGGRGAGAGGGFSDFFAQMFGDFFQRGGRGGAHGGAGAFGRAAGKRRGADVEGELELSIADALRGGKRAFSLRAAVPCAACDGEGRTDYGVCPSCAGLGHRTEQRQVEVAIPKDVYDGQVLRLRGLGQPGQGGGPQGDLLLQMRMSPDDVYRLHGHDVEADVVIAPWEALDGVQVDVPVPAGTAKVKIPAGTNAGEKLRLRGQGLARRGGERGDLFLVVRLGLPRQLSEEQKATIRALGKAGGVVRGGVRQ